jgi:hypothetical protein
MQVKGYIFALQHKQCCHGEATTRSIFIVGVEVAVNNKKVFSVAMEIQQRVPFALLWSCKIFRTAVNNIRY